MSQESTRDHSEDSALESAPGDCWILCVSSCGFFIHSSTWLDWFTQWQHSSLRKRQGLLPRRLASSGLTGFVEPLRLGRWSWFWSSCRTEVDFWMASASLREICRDRRILWSESKNEKPRGFFILGVYLKLPGWEEKTRPPGRTEGRRRTEGRTVELRQLKNVFKLSAPLEIRNLQGRWFFIFSKKIFY